LTKALPNTLHSYLRRNENKWGIGFIFRFRFRAHFAFQAWDSWPSSIDSTFCKRLLYFFIFDIPIVFFEQDIWSVDVDVLFMNVKEYESTKLVGCWTTYEFCKNAKKVSFFFTFVCMCLQCNYVCAYSLYIRVYFREKSRANSYIFMFLCYRCTFTCGSKRQIICSHLENFLIFIFCKLHQSMLVACNISLH
jgi:hypothetical protein